MARICTRCVMDDSDSGITFDEQGQCNVCTRYLEQTQLRGYRAGITDEALKQLISQIKKAGIGLEFDCVLGLSGGVDSSYMAYMAHQHGLRVLAVHVDTGWNSEMAVRNIERVCNGLGYELHTIVIDWPTMKELMRAYMFSGLANLDVPQDHLFCAAVYRFAKEYGVKYLLNGSNLATEGDSPPFSAQHSYRDYWEIQSVYRKHFESRFTKWFQSMYLPHKFGYDKRRYHLSCLVLNGEMTREEALQELAIPPYPVDEMAEDEAYILKKLDIIPAQWVEEMQKPPVKDNAYFSQAGLYRLAGKVLGSKGLDKMKSRNVHPVNPSQGA